MAGIGFRAVHGHVLAARDEPRDEIGTKCLAPGSGISLALYHLLSEVPDHLRATGDRCLRWGPEQPCKLSYHEDNRMVKKRQLYWRESTGQQSVCNGRSALAQRNTMNGRIKDLPKRVGCPVLALDLHVVEGLSKRVVCYLRLSVAVGAVRGV